MRSYIVKLPAGQDVQIGGLNADYMRIIDGSDRLSVTPDELQPLEGMQKGMSYRTAQAFSRLTLRSEVDQNVEIMIGFGNISDDRLNISGSIDASSTGKTITIAADTVATAAGLLLPSDGERRSIMIRNMDAANRVFLGVDSAVTTSSGWPVEPGEVITIDKAPCAAIYVIAESAAVDVRVLVEAD